MNRRYALILTLLGVAQLGLAVGAGSWLPLLVWSGLSWTAVGFAYGGVGAGVFGKGRDGDLCWGNVLALLPYLLFTWGVWHLRRLLSREAVADEVTPGLWLGRRCREAELPPSITLVVDLTSEFAEPRGVRNGRTYLCLPTLDAAAPDAAAFQIVVLAVAGWSGPAYVHCALGHGRSAMLVMAVLLETGRAASVVEAERMVREARVRVKLNAVQRRLLDDLIRARLKERR